MMFNEKKLTKKEKKYNNCMKKWNLNKKFKIGLLKGLLLSLKNYIL